MAIREGFGRLVLLVFFLMMTLMVSSSTSLPSLSLPSLVPAFVWSNHRVLDSDLHRINYQTLSSEEFAETVKHEFVWKDLSSSQDEAVDVVIAFIGDELRSRDLSRQSAGSKTPDLLQVLNGAVTSSNSSLALPYVTPPKDGVSLTDVLLKSIVGDLDEDKLSRLGEVVTAGGCVYKWAIEKTLYSLDSLKGYLSERKETKGDSSTDIVIICSRSEVQLRGSKSEGEIVDEVLWGLDKLETRYVALYATDPSAENDSQSIPLKAKGRQLGSVLYDGEVFCDGVCQTKAHLLEGLFVGLTLLIILISGLCCMAGITSPSRFEQAKEGQ